MIKKVDHHACKNKNIFFSDLIKRSWNVNDDVKKKKK